MAQMSELSNQLTKIAAQARLISLAATEIHHIGAIGDGDMQGIIDLADRIERTCRRGSSRRARSTAGLADNPAASARSHITVSGFRVGFGRRALYFNLIIFTL